MKLGRTADLVVFGTLQPNFLIRPGLFRLDLNLLRRIPICERRELFFRADAVNATDIDSPAFGRIIATLPGSNRVIEVGARFNW